jgi:hypothetical protein
MEDHEVFENASRDFSALYEGQNKQAAVEWAKSGKNLSYEQHMIRYSAAERILIDWKVEAVVLTIDGLCDIIAKETQDGQHTGTKKCTCGIFTP